MKPKLKKLEITFNKEGIKPIKVDSSYETTLDTVTMKIRIPVNIADELVDWLESMTVKGEFPENMAGRDIVIAQALSGYFGFLSSAKEK